MKVAVAARLSSFDRGPVFTALLILVHLLLPDTAFPAVPSVPWELEYRCPAGWKLAKETPRVLQLNHVDEDERSSGILISAGLPMKSTLRRALRDTLAGSLKGFDIDHRRATQRRTPSGRDALVLEQDVENDDDVELYVAAIVLEGEDDTFDFALLMTPDRAAKYDRQEEFEQLFRSLSFSGRAEEPAWDASVAGKENGLDALFWSQRMVNSLNAFGGMDLRLEIDYLRFYPDGHVYRGLPDEGSIDDLDQSQALRSEARKNPTHCGTYRLSKTRITFSWLDNYGLLETERLRYEFAEDGDLDLDGRKLWRLTPYRDLRLEGSFGNLSHSSGSNLGDTTSVTSQKSFTFRRDGTFELTGFSAFNFSRGEGGGDRTSGAGKSDRKAQKGTYAIDGHTLTLTFGNGSEARRTFHWLEPDEDSDGIVYVNGKNYNG